MEKGKIEERQRGEIEKEKRWKKRKVRKRTDKQRGKIEKEDIYKKWKDRVEKGKGRGKISEREEKVEER